MTTEQNDVEEYINILQQNLYIQEHDARVIVEKIQPTSRNEFLAQVSYIATQNLLSSASKHIASPAYIFSNFGIHAIISLQKNNGNFIVDQLIEGIETQKFTAEESMEFLQKYMETIIFNSTIKHIRESHVVNERITLKETEGDQYTFEINMGPCIQCTVDLNTENAMRFVIYNKIFLPKKHSVDGPASQRANTTFFMFGLRKTIGQGLVRSLVNN